MEASSDTWEKEEFLRQQDKGLALRSLLRAAQVYNLFLALEAEPENIYALRSLAMWLEDHHDDLPRFIRKGKAIDYINEALRIDPNNKGIYITLASVYQKRRFQTLDGVLSPGSIAAYGSPYVMDKIEKARVFSVKQIDLLYMVFQLSQRIKTWTHN